MVCVYQSRIALFRRRGVIEEQDQELRRSGLGPNYALKPTLRT